MRTHLNLIVDVLAFLVGAALTSTGALLAWRLPPGQHGPTLLGWTRHQWGDLHLWLAIALVVLMVVHLLLHLDWIGGICQAVGAHCGVLGRRWALPVLLLFLGVIILALPFLLPVDRRAPGSGPRHEPWETRPFLRPTTDTSPSTHPRPLTERP
jgi:hypothetical protein